MSATLQELLECGLYFGHPSKQFDPRMKPYIFAKRQGIFIIDLEKTMTMLEEACRYLREAAREGKEIIVVGTKRQVQELVRQGAADAGAHYMANRWLGGTLTNFSTIAARIRRLNELMERENAGETGFMTKKEASVLRKEKERLLKNLEGLREMKRLPDIMLVFDVRKEEIAVREARACGIKVVAVVDTNSNPELVDVPVPANDDGIKGLRLLMNEFCSAIKSGQNDRDLFRKAKEAEQARKDAEAKKAAEEKKAALAAEAAKAAAQSAGAPDAAETAAETPAPAAEAAPETPAPAAEAAPEAGEKEAKKAEKAEVKPKPRPRIRAKVKRTEAGKQAQARKKPRSAEPAAGADAGKSKKQEKGNE